MYRPDHHTAHHTGAVTGMEFVPLHQLPRLRDAFDSVDRGTLWKLLRHFGVPEKLTNIIRNSYEGLTCRVVDGSQLTDAFQVRTGVRQGCLLSLFLFLLAIDWVMTTSTTQKRNGIHWSLWTQLDDLDFADDLALLSHSQQQMQEKTNIIAGNSAQLNISAISPGLRAISNWTDLLLQGGIMLQVTHQTTR